MMEFNLREVFSILDENNEGQIQLRRFVDVANNYYSDADQLARITKALDPYNTGFINFNQFCDGIAQISSLQGVPLKEVASDLTRLSRENLLAEDSDRRSLNQEDSTTTFYEYDVDSEEKSHLHNSNKHQTFNNKTRTSNKNSILIPSTSPNNQSISPTLDSAIFGDEEEFSGIAEPHSNDYLSDSVVRPRHVTPQSVVDVLRRNNYLKPITPTEEVEQQLQDSVEELQKTVQILSSQKEATTHRLAKIQGENTDLKKRLLALEDRFQDLEGQQSRTNQSEQQKYVEFFNKNDQRFQQEKQILESSIMRINAVEAELEETKSTNGSMKKDVTQLIQKLEDVDIQLRISQSRCNYLAENNEKLLEQIDLQSKQLEQVAERSTVDSSNNMLSHTSNKIEDIIKNSENRIQELDAQCRALKLENNLLKNENDELREHAVAASIDEGRRLINSHGSLSYAAELEVLSKDELMSKLRDQLLVNDRLRQYIERMLSVIIENSPQLLEVTMNATATNGVLTNPVRDSSSIISTEDIEKKSIPLEPLKQTDSMKDDLICEAIPAKQQSKDKYCHVS